jgi:hypothetical protein
MGGKALAQLQAKYRTQLFLCPANKRSPSERLLVCEGSLASFQGLIPSLLSSFPQPLQYADQEQPEPHTNVLDMPLSTAALQYHRRTRDLRGLDHPTKRFKATSSKRGSPCSRIGSRPLQSPGGAGHAPIRSGSRRWHLCHGTTHPSPSPHPS